jgi:hypothetical protein
VVEVAKTADVLSLRRGKLFFFRQQLKPCELHIRILWVRLWVLLAARFHVVSVRLGFYGKNPKQR